MAVDFNGVQGIKGRLSNSWQWCCLRTCLLGGGVK